MKALKTLLNNEETNLPKWVLGNIPHHYKRITADPDEALRLAAVGQAKINAYFGERLYFTQAVIAGACLSDDFDTVVVVSPSQYGKLIADDVPVLTSNGWKNHGDLKVGDEVVGLDGKWKKIEYVHPKQMTDRVVVLESGEEIECHHNHEWVVKNKNSRTGERSLMTRSVAEMEKIGVADKDGKRKFVLPTAEPLEGTHRCFKVPPYVMGAWLGDGSTTKGHICGHPDDRAVLDECRKYYPEGSEWAHKDTGVVTVGYTGLATDLRNYGMCHWKERWEKFIPDEYLTADIQQRLLLLAGLMDTDGYSFFDKRSGHTRMYFTTAGEKLKDTFESLISTFGWKVSTVKIEPRESSSGIKGTKPYYRIGFQPTMEIPCVLERKRVKGIGKQRGRGISEIRKCEPRQGNCITVEGGVYCVGKHLIPTHNSWLMAMIIAIRAFEKKHECYVAGGDGDKTTIILSYLFRALQGAAPEMKNALNSEAKDKLDKLATSVSKTKLSFADGGTIEPLSLGENFRGNLSKNKSVGRGGDMFVDEAALLSEATYAELGRRDFKAKDGTKCLQVLLSNPHQPGMFYDKLTDDDPDARTLIIWMDILTAIEEGSTTRDTVLHSDFAKNKSTRKRYLMCELDSTDDSMFGEPVVYDDIDEGDDAYKQYFLGVDPAYKGKDSIEMATISLDENLIVRVESIIKINKANWVDGGTSEEITRIVARQARVFGASMTCVDAGWGVWLIEALSSRGVEVRGIQFGERPSQARVKTNDYAATNAFNKRAEMHIDLQTLIEDRQIRFHADAWAQVKDIFPFVTCERNAGGKLQIRKKSDIKKSIGRSPDELDAVLLAVQAMMISLVGLPQYIIRDE